MSSQLPLWGIAYVSTAIAGVHREDLEFLLIEGRRLNHKNDITGVLLYSSGNFMQYFEGPKDAALSTFDRICASRRHYGIIELLNEPVSSRSFSGWDMGLVEASDSELLKVSTANWTRQLQAPCGPSSDGLVLLKQFWSDNATG